MAGTEGTDQLDQVRPHGSGDERQRDDHRVADQPACRGQPAYTTALERRLRPLLPHTRAQFFQNSMRAAGDHKSAFRARPLPAVRHSAVMGGTACHVHKGCAGQSPPPSAVAVLKPSSFMCSRHCALVAALCAQQLPMQSTATVTAAPHCPASARRAPAASCRRRRRAWPGTAPRPGSKA